MALGALPLEPGTPFLGLADGSRATPAPKGTVRIGEWLVGPPRPSKARPRLSPRESPGNCLSSHKCPRGERQHALVYR